MSPGSQLSHHYEGFKGALRGSGCPHWLRRVPRVKVLIPAPLTDWLIFFCPSGSQPQADRDVSVPSVGAWSRNACACQRGERRARTCIIYRPNDTSEQANTCSTIPHMHASHTSSTTASPLSLPRLPYSWAGSAASCIIMARIPSLFWPLLALRPACASLKCHVSTDYVFWAPKSIIWHATLSKAVDPLLTDTLVHFFTCVALCFVSTVCPTSKSWWVLLHVFLPFFIYILERHVCCLKPSPPPSPLLFLLFLLLFVPSPCPTSFSATFCCAHFCWTYVSV